MVANLSQHYVEVGGFDIRKLVNCLVVRKSTPAPTGDGLEELSVASHDTQDLIAPYIVLVKRSLLRREATEKNLFRLARHAADFLDVFLLPS